MSIKPHYRIAVKGDESNLQQFAEELKRLGYSEDEDDEFKALVFETGASFISTFTDGSFMYLNHQPQNVITANVFDLPGELNEALNAANDLVFA